MSGENPDGRKEKDPADALAALAAGAEQPVAAPEETVGQDDPSAALDKMDGGGGDAVADLESLASGEDSASEGAAIPLTDQTQGSAPAAEVVAPAAMTPEQVRQERRRRAASIDGQQARAHAHMYRRTMIPLLLTVAGLLVVVGVASAFMVLTAPSAERNPALVLIMVVSFPLAAVLLFGAWWFRREVRQSGS